MFLNKNYICKTFDKNLNNIEKTLQKELKQHN